MKEKMRNLNREAFE